MADLKTTAEAIACALDLGLLRTAEAEAWIDHQIMTLAQPPIALIEACGAAGSRQQLVDALRQFPGNVDRPGVIRQCFYHARSALLHDASLVRPIARWLFRLAVDQEAPSSDAASLMYWFDDELDLIESGTKASTPDHVVRTMDGFLEQYGERPN
jgi:hypothetical protein